MSVLTAAGRHLWFPFHHISRFTRTVEAFGYSQLQDARASISAKAGANPDTPTGRALRLPYPPEPLDLNVFEDMDEETASEAPSVDDQAQNADDTTNRTNPYEGSSKPQGLNKSSTGTAPCQALRRIVHRGDFLKAESLRVELEALRVPIIPHSMYRFSALHALRHEYPTITDRRKSFLAWWTLIPTSEWPSTFWRARRAIMNYPIDVRLIHRLCKLAISAGHTKSIARPLLAFLMRYAHMEEGHESTLLAHFDTNARIRALQQAVEADFTGADDHSSKAEQPWSPGANMGIRTHALAGRPVRALRTLNKAHASGVHVKPETHRIVYQRLKAAGLEQLASRVQDLADTDVSQDDGTTSSTLSLKNDGAIGAALPAPLTRHTISSYNLPRASLLDKFRVLRLALASAQVSPDTDKQSSHAYTPPFAHALADFLFHLDAANTSPRRRWRPYLALRNHVQTNYRASVRGQLICGELLYFSSLSHGRPIAVLRTFLANFIPVGIPASRAKQLLQYYEDPANIRRFKQGDLDWALSRELSQYRSPRHKVKENWRMWPTSMALKLVWRALASLTRGPVDVERLYRCLMLQFDRVYEDIPLEALDADESAVLQILSEPEFFTSMTVSSPPSKARKSRKRNVLPLLSQRVTVPPAVRPTSTWFIPFINRFCTLKVSDRNIFAANQTAHPSYQAGPGRAALALRDMQRVGLPITKQCWAALARGYARAGQVSKVDAILAHVEKTYIRPYLESTKASSGGEDVEGVDTVGQRMEDQQPEDEEGDEEGEIESANEEGKQERALRFTLGLYTSLIRTYTECGLYQQARDIQKRMQDLGVIDRVMGWTEIRVRKQSEDEDEGTAAGAGFDTVKIAKMKDPRLRAALHLLSRHEKGHYEKSLEGRKTMTVEGRLVYADRARSGGRAGNDLARLVDLRSTAVTNPRLRALAT